MSILYYTKKFYRTAINSNIFLITHLRLGEYSNLQNNCKCLETTHFSLHHANTLSPIIERINVVMKKIRQKVAGS